MPRYRFFSVTFSGRLANKDPAMNNSSLRGYKGATATRTRLIQSSRGTL